MPELERVQQNTPITLSQQWYEDGVAIDPGTVTVGITRADGTVLVAPGQSTGGATTAARTFNLTTTHTALLDRLTVTWTSTGKGTLVSYVEVAGGFLFSLAELKALLPTATAASMVAARLRAEQILERRLSVAFVPRYERETVRGEGGGLLGLTWPRVRSIRAVSYTVSGITTTLSAGDLALLATDNGFLSGYSWTYGYDFTVGYEHGWSFPEEPIRNAALALAHYYLTTGIVGSEGVDPRVAYITTPEGRINYGTDGLGLPMVELAVRDYDMSVGVA